jgi:hypothetical protein
MHTSFYLKVGDKVQSHMILVLVVGMVDKDRGQTPNLSITQSKPALGVCAVHVACSALVSHCRDVDKRQARVAVNVLRSQGYQITFYHVRDHIYNLKSTLIQHTSSIWMRSKLKQVGDNILLTHVKCCSVLVIRQASLVILIFPAPAHCHTSVSTSLVTSANKQAQFHANPHISAALVRAAATTRYAARLLARYTQQPTLLNALLFYTSCRLLR